MKITTTIKIETGDFESVKVLLDEYLGLEDLPEHISVYGLTISVMDNTYEVDYTVAFMKERGIIEKGPLDDYYNYEKAKITVFVVMNPFSLLTECLPSLAEGIAKFITRHLRLRCAVFIGDLPVCAYDKGEKVVEVKESYDYYYKHNLLP